MDGVRLEDVRRALTAQDPNLPQLVLALATSPDPQQDQPVRAGALTFQSFLRELRSWQFSYYKTDDEKMHYRIESWKTLESEDAETSLPDRLYLHEIIMELWEKNGPYERECLIEIIATCPLKWGPWRALKKIFKESEKSGDVEILGALAARFEQENAGYYFYSEVSRATLLYMIRRAWRHLRRLGESFPATYADAAVEVLRHYNEGISWNRTWIANHIFYHESNRYNQSRFTFWSAPNDILEHRAFPHAWQITPRPLFSLLERAKAEKVRQFAIEALKKDFRTVLREVEASWVVRLTGVESASTHEFVVWLLDNVPKFEQGSFRELGLHEAVLRLFDSPSNTARTYAASYAQAHARDLPLSEIIRLTNNDNQNVRRLAFSLLVDLDPRKDVGLDAWGKMLGTRYGHDTAVEVLQKHFGASELTAAWFKERLLSDNNSVVEFAKQLLPRTHSLKSLGPEYLTSLFDEEDLGRNAAAFALERLRVTFNVSEVDTEFWRRSLLHPLSSNTIKQRIQEEKIEARVFGIGFWRSLSYHPTWDEDEWVKNLKESGRVWAKDLAFNENLAGFARGILGDVRQFSAYEVGFDWLMELVERLENHYHHFAVNYMLKSFVPSDFAPRQEGEEAPGASTSEEADLSGSSFLFTGKLATMTRKEAQQKVTDANGTNAKSVTSSLDYLVVGDDGSPLFGQGRKGSKILKAEGLRDEGHDVKIISETAFLQMLAGEQREVSADQALAGSEVLWSMATQEGDSQEPRRDFAIKYIKHHHEDIGPSLTDRSVDPGAEIPRAFFTFERIRALLEDERALLRNFGLDISRWEFARWSPSLHDLVELCEQANPSVTTFIEEAFMAPEIKESEPYRLSRGHLSVDGVYRFCESLDRSTRRIGMALIAKYEDLAIPSELFRLTESPDRQMRAFVIRTLWSLYRDRGITMHWKPVEVETLFTKAKTKKGLQEYETGPGPKQRPEEDPAHPEALRAYLRRELFGVPPAKLSKGESIVEQAPEGEEEGNEVKPKRVRPIPARIAKLSLIEVVRDLAVEEESFAQMVSPLLREFMDSRGRSERDACIVALTRIGKAHPGIDVWEAR